jgi:hypothetical protein
MRAGWRLWRQIWLLWAILVAVIAGLFWWQFVASLAWVLLTLVHCVRTIMSDCKKSFVDILMFLFGVFWGDVRREFMRRLSAALHGSLGSYVRDALLEGSADAVACLPVPRAQVFTSFLLFAWWPPLLFLVRNAILV